MTVLALNCGSSSLKYAVFSGEDAVLRGALDRIGLGGPVDHAAAVRTVFAELERHGTEQPRVVGQRVVHGGPDHVEPALVDDALFAALERATPFAPLHLPVELAAIAAVRER